MPEDASRLALPPQNKLRAAPRDPLTLLLAVCSLAAVPACGFRPVLAPAIAVVVIALFLVRRGDLAGARLFALAAALRLWAGAGLRGLAGAGAAIFPDEADYSSAASLIGELSRGDPVPGIPAFSDAGIGYLYAPFTALGGGSIESLRGASALAGALAVLALWRVGKAIAGRRAAKRAAFLLAVFPSVVIWSASGLKEGFVLLFAILLVGLATSSPARPVLRASLADVAWIWVCLYVLASLRESIAFAIAGATVLTAVAVGIAGLRRRTAGVDTRIRTLVVSASLIAAIGTSLWAAGFGVMGIGALDAVRPGAINKAHSLEASGNGLANRVEATSAVEPADATMIRRMVTRLPSGLALALLRPFPLETTTGGLSSFSDAARMVIIPDQLLWYAALPAGVIGAVRLLKRRPERALLTVIFLIGTAFFFALAQGNVGTAYRLRTSIVPFVLLLTFVPRRPRKARSADRAALVIPTLGEGGTERHALMTARELDRAGVEARIAAFTGGIHEDEADALGGQIVGRKGRFDLLLPIRLARALGADCVWLTYLFAGNFWGGLGARLAGAPLISNIRTTHPRSLPARLLEPLTAGELVLANSDAVAVVAAMRGIDPKKIRVVRNGIDSAAVAGRAAEGSSEARGLLGIGHAELLVVVPGRIDQLKAQLLAVEAFAAADIADSRLVLAGAATLDTELEYLAKVEAAAQPHGERILMPGMIQNLPALMAAADIVLLTSEHEGMPNALLEAMAVGTPIVATDAGGVPEAVTDGETGILCHRGDAAAIADALRSLAGDPARREMMGEAGHERVEMEFRIERECMQLIAQLEFAAAIAAADDAPFEFEKPGARILNGEDALDRSGVTRR